MGRLAEVIADLNNLGSRNNNPALARAGLAPHIQAPNLLEAQSSLYPRGDLAGLLDNLQVRITVVLGTELERHPKK